MSEEQYWKIGETAAKRKLSAFFDRIGDYPAGRDYPADEATSKLSPHLAFGEISPRQVWHAAAALAEREAAAIAGRLAGGDRRQPVALAAERHQQSDDHFSDSHGRPPSMGPGRYRAACARLRHPAGGMAVTLPKEIGRIRLVPAQLEPRRLALLDRPLEQRRPAIDPVRELAVGQGEEQCQHEAEMDRQQPSHRARVPPEEKREARHRREEEKREQARRMEEERERRKQERI